MKVRRATLGDAYVDQSLKARTDFNTDFQEFITRIAWGDVWTRPGLERKLRSIVVIVSTLSLGHWDEFRLHLRGALNNGVTRDEIKEIILHCAVYAGVPAANHAMKEAQSVLADLGKP
jgi:4-carboxymuconolactone decarboxylase